ncbi:FecR family protein [Chitinophaga skermanii]|uniref:FecR family protein n=1 Tax=Chitinophaga skermanii TaxID=331697 RepID=A0A327QKL2_9BACT|nr:FecR family protein [Chitinophaga skermanii]RAJ05186.1 FecR family protein [Chitinophaga skermanii]
MDYTLYRAEDFAADESFIRYYQRTDEEAVAFWENWMRCHPSKIDEIVLAEMMLSKLMGHLPQAAFEAEQARMQAFLQTASSYTPPSSTPKKSIVKMLRPYLVAACGLLIILVTLYIYHKPANNPAELGWTYFKNSPSQRTTIELPDGSTIMLNAGTSIRYAMSAAKDSLQVYLDGEAFFNVSQHANRAFLVHGGDMHVKVLGTTFNMSYYPEVGKSTVALVQGKISVSAKGDHLVELKPNEAASFDQTSASFATGAFNKEEVLGWQQDQLYFTKANFAEIKQRMKRMYNITLINRSTVNNMQYTGHFTNAGFQQVVESICFANGLGYTVSRDTVILKNQ